MHFRKMEMKQKKVSRDIPAWAGSTPDDLLYSDYDITEEMKATNWKRLYEIKHKLVDIDYLDGAIASIAEMVSNTIRNKPK